MSIFAKKKQILSATLIVALAAAVTVNWYYSKPTKKPAADSGASQSTESEPKNLGDSLLVAGSSVSEENSADETGGTTALEEGNVSNEEYFASVRLEQSKANAEVENIIKKAIESTSLNDTDKKELSLLLDKYNADIKTQSDCEALIKAKIGGECVVIINGQTAQVIIESGKSNETAVLQITEIIVNNTHISPENLTIIEAK